MHYYSVTQILDTKESPEPGDVGAYKLPGGGSSFTGHTGIMISDLTGGITSMSAHRNYVGPPDRTQFHRSRIDVVVVSNFAEYI